MYCSFGWTIIKINIIVANYYSVCYLKSDELPEPMIAGVAAESTSNIIMLVSISKPYTAVTATKQNDNTLSLHLIKTR